MLGWLARSGFRRGLVGGNRVWAVVGITAMTIRLIRRLLGEEDKVVYSEKLRPGESLLIAHDREAEVVQAPPR